MGLPQLGASCRQARDFSPRSAFRFGVSSLANLAGLADPTSWTGTDVPCVLLPAGGLFFSPGAAVALWIGIADRVIAVVILALLSMLLARAREDELALETLRHELASHRASLRAKAVRDHVKRVSDERGGETTVSRLAYTREG
jgi:hypothetical protein